MAPARPTFELETSPPQAPEETVKKSVVSMKNGRLSYGKGQRKKEVLTELTMNVQQGTM